MHQVSTSQCAFFLQWVVCFSSDHLLWNPDWGLLKWLWIWSEVLWGIHVTWVWRVCSLVVKSIFLSSVWNPTRAYDLVSWRVAPWQRTMNLYTKRGWNLGCALSLSCSWTTPQTQACLNQCSRQKESQLILMITATCEQARPCERPKGETNLHKLLFANNSRENSAKLKQSNTTCRLGGIKLSISAWILCKTFLFPLLFRLTFFKEENYKPRSWICVQYFSFFVSSLVFSQFARQKTSKTIAWIVFFWLISLLSSLLICSLQIKKTTKQEHELFADLFLFVFS